MKVLWFANTPCGASEKLFGKPLLGGGWLYSLSQELVKKSDIDLHIGFYWGEDMPPFIYNDITYHPIYRKGENSRLGRVINRYLMAYSDKLDRQALPQLMSTIHEISPDIIHIHGSEENFGILARERFSCPIVLSIQGILSSIIMFYYRGITKAVLKKEEGILAKLSMGGTSTNEKSLLRRGKRERDFLYAIPNIIGRTFWDKACSLAINPNRNYYEVGEIMRSQFTKSCWKKEKFNTPLIISSTISSGIYKGIESVFETAVVLKTAHFDFKWNIIGLDRNERVLKIVEKMVGYSAEDLNIILLGKKNADEMVELMTSSDIYVQTSHIENSSNSLCEAMLLGMPIIATFAGGTASILSNNVEGRLIQDGDPYSMAGMIMEMAYDFEMSKKMGQKAAEIARKRHAPERVCNQLLTAYHSILGR